MRNSKSKIYHQKKYWFILVALLLLLKLLTSNAVWTERYYTQGLYPPLSRAQRFVTGWLPVSIGDILYLLAIVYLLYAVIKTVTRLLRRQVTWKGTLNAVVRDVFVVLCIVMAFYWFWGANYSRQGIAVQLQLEDKKYTLQDLDTLTSLLQKRLNEEAPLVNLKQREHLKDKNKLFAEGTQAYLYASMQYPFLAYSGAAVKPSLFGLMGNYMGFQGYYNPFTGEAQVNTACPLFVQPFVLTHEIAHQLGYAKENEANFVGYLTCRVHPTVHFRYAAYFSMYQYAIGELYARDSVHARQYLNSVHPLVRQDLKDYQVFYQKYRNQIEPLLRWLYGNYLKANNQPKGNQTYDEVVTWLIAYYKRNMQI